MTDVPQLSSFTPEALAVVNRSCEHYGGLELWRALKCIRLIPRQLSGLVPWLKGFGRTFQLPTAFEIEPRARRVRFIGYPDPDHIGVFHDGAVRVERAASGEVVAGAAEPRASFRGLRKNRRWTPSDALYFFGYALTHYHALPFTLPAGRLIRMSSSERGRVAILDVELPADLPTHCRRQRFHFDPAGRILRHDYHAEILGFWARGAHFWERETKVRGFPLAFERHVVARLGSVPTPITALHASFADADVILDHSPSFGDVPA